MEQLMRLSAACAVGLERVLAGELERLGLNEAGRSAGRVAFTTDSAGIARALVGLRTADRVFLELGSFPAPDFDALFEGIRSLPWERWVGKQDRLVVEKARSLRSALAAQTALQSVAQKAAYERLCAQYRVSRMPDTGTAVATRLRLEDNRATIELDLCGSPLSKRGYRRSPTEAPLKETVAAAVLFLSGWRRSLPLYDPFCGSGTIAIEAALYGLDISPGLNRSFAWETMPQGGALAIRAEKERARTLVRSDRELMIAASDTDDAAIKAAQANARLAGVADVIRFSRAKAEDAEPFAARGCVVTDPPYGKRLGSPEDADRLYASLGGFRERFRSWDLCWVVDREDFRLPGAGSAKKTKIQDGAETRWLQRFIASAPSSSPGGRPGHEGARGTQGPGKTKATRPRP